MIDKGRKELFVELMLEGLDGFSFVKSKNAFAKKMKDKEYIISINPATMFLSYVLSYKIKIYEIENIKKKAFMDGYSKYSTSISLEKYQLLPKERIRNENELMILTLEDVKNNTKLEIDFYNEKIKDWFKKHSDISYLDTLLNENPKAITPIGFGVEIYCLAIITAYLNYNSKLEKLITQYRSFIPRDGQFSKYSLTRFDAVADYIQTHPTNGSRQP